MDSLWINRLFARGRTDYFLIVPIWLCLFLGTQVADISLLGPDAWWNPPEGNLLKHTGFLLFLLLSGLIATTFWTRYSEHKGTRGDLEQLRPLLNLSDSEYADLVRGISCINSAVLRLSGVFFAGVAFLIMVLSPPLASVHPTDFYIHVVLVPLVGWVTGTAIACGYHQYQLFKRLRPTLQPISPYAPDAYRPLVRRGIRRAIDLFINVAFLGAIIGLLSTPWPALIVVSILWAFAAFNAAAPILSVRAAIRKAKRDALVATRRALHQQAAIILNEGAEGNSSKIGGLLSVHGYLQSVSEWPVELDDAVRFIRASSVAGASTFLTKQVAQWLTTLA